MEYPCIALHIDAQVCIPFSGEYTNLTDGDLEVLLQQSHEASACLQQEKERRHLGTFPVEPEEKDYSTKLRQTADTLAVLERLDERSSKHVDIAIKTLEKPQDNRAFKIYRDFLQDVMRHCSPGLVLLCAVSFGKQRIANMIVPDRVRLIQFIKEKKDSFSYSILESLAEKYEIPNRESAYHSLVRELVLILIGVMNTHSPDQHKKRKLDSNLQVQLRSASTKPNDQLLESRNRHRVEIEPGRRE